jgi:hypothetical protein
VRSRGSLLGGLISAVRPDLFEGFEGSLRRRRGGALVEAVAGAGNGDDVGAVEESVEDGAGCRG